MPAGNEARFNGAVLYAFHQHSKRQLIEPLRESFLEKKLIKRLILVSLLSLSAISVNVFAAKSSSSANGTTSVIACDAAREDAEKLAKSLCKYEGGLDGARQGECKVIKSCDSCEKKYSAEVKFDYFCKGK